MVPNGRDLGAGEPAAESVSFGSPRVAVAQRVATRALLLAAAVLLLSWCRRGGLPGPEALDPALRQVPRQTDTRRPPFTFAFGGETYEVQPRADYELWGLVVSHNDPQGLGDVYHDERSVDTLDVCVIFGDNVQRDDYLRTEFSSGSWTCWVQYPAGVQFSSGALSNNHLVTSDETVRQRIAGIRRGDQVHIRGSLVNYRAARHPELWRKTSLTRRDDGQGACEVIYVDSLDVLGRGTPGWHLAFDASLWIVALLALGKLGLLVAGVMAHD